MRCHAGPTKTMALGYCMIFYMLIGGLFASNELAKEIDRLEWRLKDRINRNSLISTEIDEKIAQLNGVQHALGVLQERQLSDDKNITVDMLAEAERDFKVLLTKLGDISEPEKGQHLKDIDLPIVRVWNRLMGAKRKYVGAANRLKLSINVTQLRLYNLYQEYTIWENGKLKEFAAQIKGLEGDKGSVENMLAIEIRQCKLLMQRHVQLALLLQTAKQLLLPVEDLQSQVDTFKQQMNLLQTSMDLLEACTVDVLTYLEERDKKNNLVRVKHILLRHRKERISTLQRALLRASPLQRVAETDENLPENELEQLHIN